MICAGVITSLHGIKGNVKLKLYLKDNFDFKAHPVFIDGANFKVNSYFYKNQNSASATVVLTLAEVTSAAQAELLINKEIFIEKAALPFLMEEEFYFQDLVNAEIIVRGQAYGKVLAVHNFGASDILEIQLKERPQVLALPNGQTEVKQELKKSAKKLIRKPTSILVPFTKEYCLEVDVAKKQIHIELPEGPEEL